MRQDVNLIPIDVQIDHNSSFKHSSYIRISLTLQIPLTQIDIYSLSYDLQLSKTSLTLDLDLYEFILKLLYQSIFLFKRVIPCFLHSNPRNNS